MQVSVGDLVRLEDGEQVQADFLLLQTSIQYLVISN